MIKIFSKDNADSQEKGFEFTEIGEITDLGDFDKDGLWFIKHPDTGEIKQLEEVHFKDGTIWRTK